jgi:translation initiation factor IF-1
MARADAIEVEGTVVEALPHAMHRVELANGHRVVARFKGRGARQRPSLAPGEKVTLEMSPYDLSQGCIVGNEKEI